MPQFTLFARAVACCTLVVASTSAAAGVFSISPVRVHFGPKDRAVALTISNHGSLPIVLEASAYAWTQADGRDDLTPTDNLILAPAHPRVLPGAQQVVRIALLQPAAGVEATYRIVIQEIPEAAAETANAVNAPIAVALNFPVFVTPAAARRQVTCASAAEGAITCRNQGTSYALITRAQVFRSGQLADEIRNSVYILAGATRALPIDLNGHGAGEPRSLTLRFEDEQSESYALPARPGSL
ncbi:MAG: molecular chaperone [Ramlibacter sp.]